MTAQNDAVGLREALARDIADVLLEGGALSPIAFARHLLRPAGPLATLRAEVEQVKAENAEWRSQWEAMAELVCEFQIEQAPEAVALVGAERDAIAKHAARLAAELAVAVEALKPFADAWDACEAIGEQGGGYVQDADRAWVSGSAGGGYHPLFKFGDLRRARTALATITPPEKDHA